jgi:phosphohistidine phosphatase
MRRLMLLRHAKAERDSHSGSDRDRRLDSQGRADAAAMGRWMTAQGHRPERALVSAAARTRETWDLLAAEWPAAAAAADHLPELYGADPGELLHAIHAAESAVQSLLVVAHNPGLHELALALTASGDAAARTALDANLPTTGFVILDFAADAWDDVSFRGGALVCFVSPKTFRLAG